MSTSEFTTASDLHEPVYSHCRLDAALDLEYDITNRYTGSYFEQEIKGLAASSGADVNTIRRIHMIGELTYVQQIHCHL